MDHYVESRLNDREERAQLFLGGIIEYAGVFDRSFELASVLCPLQPFPTPSPPKKISISEPNLASFPFFFFFSFYHGKLTGNYRARFISEMTSRQFRPECFRKKAERGGGGARGGDCW